jgi:hypothetical protein
MSAQDDDLTRFLDSGTLLHVAADGQMSARVQSDSLLLLSGSFNPLHRGHWELAQVASEITRKPAAFELSVINADKAPLTADEIRQRLHPFNWQTDVWLTRVARFVEKAKLFPNAIFAVGADTAERVVDPSYYNGDASQMHDALERIVELGCRFLVACRIDAHGDCQRLSDLCVPPGFADLFEEIPPERFRRDVSSTALRTLRSF